MKVDPDLYMHFQDTKSASSMIGNSCRISNVEVTQIRQNSQLVVWNLEPDDESESKTPWSFPASYALRFS